MQRLSRRWKSRSGWRRLEGWFDMLPFTLRPTGLPPAARQEQGEGIWIFVFPGIRSIRATL
jgi:hypothetical protein